MGRLVVASGKGGVGTSLVASLAALAAAARGDRVLLVDANEGGGALHHLFGVRPTATLWSLVDARGRAEDVVTPLDDRLSLVAGGTSGTAAVPATDRERRVAISKLGYQFDGYDSMIVDGGSRLDTIAALTDLLDAGLLLVTSADRLALAANYALVKAVSARRAAARVAVVCNRHGDALAAEACEFLAGACSHFLARTLDVTAPIPDDPCLQAGVGAGMTVRDAVDGSPAADAMRSVLAQVLPPPLAPLDAPADRAALATFGLSSSFRRWS